MSHPSTKTKITFVITTPLYVELSFKKFAAMFSGTEEEWVRLVEKAGLSKEFADDATVGLEVSLKGDNDDVGAEAQANLEGLIWDTLEEVREKLKEEKMEECSEPE